MPEAPGAPDFRALFEAVPAPLLVLLPDAPRFTIVAVSNAYLRATMTKRDGPDGIVGRGLFAVFPDPPGDPTATGTSNLRASLERAIAAREPDTMAVQHYDIRRPDGSWEERHWSPVNTPVCDRDTGRVTHLIHRVEDVTDLLRVTRRESDRAAQAAGLERRTVELQAELVRRAQELQAANDRLRVAYVRAVMALGGGAAPNAATDAAAEVERAEREAAAVRTGGQPHDAAAELAAVSAALERTTVALIERTAEAERATAQAREANAAKAQFLAMMSHELRTPLNGIAGHAELLAMGIHGPVTPAQREALDRIRRGQQHLLGLINEVLSFAKLEAGRVQFTAGEVPLLELVRDLEALVAPQALARGVRLVIAEAAESGGRPVTAYADPERVRQVVLNLLSNAVKFTEPGGTVTVSCAPRADGRVAIRVADTGCGIPPDQLDRIFEPFVQVGRSLAARAGGTGLGLAISRDLARGMGGDLTVESAVGVGSTFTLRLPADVVAAAEDDRGRRIAE